MPLTSDLTISTGKFNPEAISGETKKFNNHLVDIMKGAPKWHEVRISSLIYNRELRFLYAASSHYILTIHFPNWSFLKSISRPAISM